MQNDLRELYQEVILDHGRNPRNFRHPESYTGTAEGYNPLCGDQLTVFLTRGADGCVSDVAFEGRGCAISVASASLMTEIVKGKTAAEVMALFEHFHNLASGQVDGLAREGLEEEAERLEVLAGVGQYPARVKCATLAWHTLKAALEGGGEATTE